MKIPAHCDVLIIGAGPTGLMLACQLARRGIRATIIERNAGPALQSRALGVQARTLEIYAQLGIAARALELGERATGANIWVEGRFGARVPVNDIGRNLSPYPYLLILGQDDNERLLGDYLREHGGQVHWNTELTGLAQDADGVRATLKNSDGSVHDIRARWVAGCDGARSAVRSLNKIDFPGAPYEHVFFVADTSVTGPMRPGELNVYLWRNEFHLFFPMRGRDHWRVAGIVPVELRDRADLKFADVVPAIRQQAGATLEFSECRWFSTYRIHHRRAEHFRAQRCFLLGDAAHIHSPVGAQGMNTGLQDAYNLAWKLALVIEGRADAALLDSYAAEREPVAEDLLRSTDRGFALVVSDHWISRVLRTRVMYRVIALAMHFERIRKHAFASISQIGIHYRRSALSAAAPDLPDDGPQAGDRFPWLHLKFAPGAAAEDIFARFDDTRFNLLAIGQPPLTATPPELDSLLHTHVIPGPDNEQVLHGAGISSPSFYLLRPDGHIGIAGKHLDAAVLSRYLIDHLRLRSLWPIHRTIATRHARSHRLIG
ncbi:MAG: FAD-dependent monooxygenase [Gammaproteobacteria bacterium]|nr:FAD-dependent monooxygenase [Gammaproteobacteria bacterium]